jgi:hypothetical protein
MSWMSASCSVHHCHDDNGGGTSPSPPEVKEEEAAGEAAMATTARLRREEEMAEDARRRSAESSGSRASQQGGGRLWSALEQVGTPICLRCLNTRDPTTGRSEINGQIRFGRRSYGGRCTGNGNSLFTVAFDSPTPCQLHQIRSGDNVLIFTKLGICSEHSSSNHLVCLSDPAWAPGPRRRDNSARLCDSASDPARGLGITTTLRVSVTQPGL